MFLVKERRTSRPNWLAHLIRLLPRKQCGKFGQSLEEIFVNLVRKWLDSHEKGGLPAAPILGRKQLLRLLAKLDARRVNPSNCRRPDGFLTS